MRISGQPLKQHSGHTLSKSQRAGEPLDRVTLRSPSQEPPFPKFVSLLAAAAVGAVPIIGGLVNGAHGCVDVRRGEWKPAALGMAGFVANLAGARALQLGHPALGVLGFAASSLVFVGLTQHAAT